MDNGTYNLFNFKHKEFNIDLEEWEKFKSIKPFYSERGGYYPKMIVWKGKEDIEFYQRAQVYLSMALRNLGNEYRDIQSSEERMSKFGERIGRKIWPYQINLLSRIYFESEMEIEEWVNEITYDYNKEVNGVMMAFKRPFGNSYVKGDVLDEIEKWHNYSTSIRGENKTFFSELVEKYSDKVLDTNEDYLINHDAITEEMFIEILDDLYDVMNRLIQTHTWKITNFDVKDTFNELDNFQLSNTYKCEYTYFIPSTYYTRKNNLKKLIKI